MSAYYVCGTGNASRLPLLTQPCVGVCFTSLIHLDVRRHPSAFAAKRADADEAVTVLVTPSSLQRRRRQQWRGGGAGRDGKPEELGRAKLSHFLKVTDLY